MNANAHATAPVLRLVVILARQAHGMVAAGNAVLADVASAPSTPANIGRWVPHPTPFAFDADASGALSPVAREGCDPHPAAGAKGRPAQVARVPDSDLVVRRGLRVAVAYHAPDAPLVLVAVRDGWASRRDGARRSF